MVHHVKKLCQTVANFVADQRGATAIEYGLIVGLIAIVIMGALVSSGSSLDALFTTIASTIANA